MAVLRINAGSAGLSLHDSPAPLTPVLTAALDGHAPIVVMVHGFKFDPGHPEHCPHDHILSCRITPRNPRALSWPRGLGLSGTGGPLGIAFGWRSGFRIGPAYHGAEAAGAALAALILRLRRIAPHRPVRAIAHSLGARVVLSALPHLTAGDLDRAVLLSPAEFAGPAAARLASPAGCAAELLAVTSGENLVFDRLLEAAIPFGWRDRALGRAGLPGLATLRLDDAATLTALARLGHPVAPPDRRVCHWSSYLRPGVFELYRALLLDTEGPSPAALRAALPAPGPGPRRRGVAGWSLPVAGNAP